MAVACAREAGEKAGEESALESVLAAIEEHIKVEVDKAAEEAGAVKGREVFGDFGAKVGAESGLKAGRKACIYGGHDELLGNVEPTGLQVPGPSVCFASSQSLSRLLTTRRGACSGRGRSDWSSR